MSQVIDRQVFIKTKEKLDHLHLSSHFAIEDLPLIAKLLAKLEEKGAEGFGKKFDETHQDTRECSEAEEALNIEVKRLVKENNGLRRDLWTAREAVQQLKVRLLQRSDVKLEKEMRQIDQIKILQEKDKRERALLAENEQLRYKYNELMDLIHEDPRFEREYIKRLLKHKKIQKKYLMEESQIVVGKIGNGVVSGDGVFGEMSLLKSKLLAREEEILRLQLIVEQNNNYLHYRFAETKKSRRETLLQEEVENLSQEIVNLKSLLAANNIKIKANTKRQSSTTKMEFLNKKYENQFIVDRKDSEEYVLEQRYTSKEMKSPRPEKVKAKSKQREQQVDEKANDAKPKNEVNKKIQNPIRLSNQYFDKVPQKEKQEDSKKPTIRHKSPQTPTVTQNSEKTLKAYTSNPKDQTKQQKQTKKSQQWHAKPTVKKPSPPAPATTPTDPKEEKPSSFQKLLQQKNKRIFELEQQLKRHTPSRSTKIISAQNVNNNNNPSNNLIIKTNKNQYININNISHQDSEENKKRASKLELELTRITKEKQKLEEKVRMLERQKVKPKEQVKVKKEEKPSRELMERIEELENAYESLQEKLVETQRLLLKTNQHNYQLQNLLNASHRSYQNSNTAHQTYQNHHSIEQQTLPFTLPIQVEKNKEPSELTKKQVDQQQQLCNEQCHSNKLTIQQLRLQISFLHAEITRLQSQSEGYLTQRQSLLARLRQLQFNLQRQAQEMRYFEEHLFHQHSTPSAVSELKQLQNQSDLSIGH